MRTIGASRDIHVVSQVRRRLPDTEFGPYVENTAKIMKGKFVQLLSTKLSEC
jgi:hypothetical protein